MNAKGFKIQTTSDSHSFFKDSKGANVTKKMVKAPVVNKRAQVKK